MTGKSLEWYDSICAVPVVYRQNNTWLLCIVPKCWHIAIIHLVGEWQCYKQWQSSWEIPCHCECLLSRSIAVFRCMHGNKWYTCTRFCKIVSTAYYREGASQLFCRCCRYAFSYTILLSLLTYIPHMHTWKGSLFYAKIISRYCRQHWCNQCFLLRITKGIEETGYALQKQLAGVTRPVRMKWHLGAAIKEDLQYNDILRIWH